MADGQCHLSFNISETRHVTQNLITDITIALKILIEKPRRKYILPYPFKYNKIFDVSLCSQLLSTIETKNKLTTTPVNIHLLQMYIRNVDII